MRLVPLLSLTLFASSIAFASASGDLPRKGLFGAATAPDPKGVKITRIVPGGSGEALGLKVDDVLETFNGSKITDVASFVADVHRINGGDKFEVVYLRDGKEARATGTLTPRPKQTEANLDVIYTQVVSLGKRIRVIVTKPKDQARHAAIFLIGGIGAYSIDGPFASTSYGNVLGPLANEGYVTVRIDKPGQGDSEGPAYKDLGFNAEADAYVQALRYTKTLPYVDASRIAIYGHSMGGCFAPVVASQESVKAVVVNGTLFQSFNEYMLENTRRQSELSQVPEDQLDQQQKSLAAMMYFMFDQMESPKEVASKHPELAAAVHENMPDGETYSGVGIPFFRELSHTNLAKAWSGTHADVLALYGENDFLSGQKDHERIVAYVNSLRPGTAQFELLKDCDHIFTKTTSMKDSMDKWGHGGEFNPVIVTALETYLKKELG